MKKSAIVLLASFYPLFCLCIEASHRRQTPSSWLLHFCFFSLLSLLSLSLKYWLVPGGFAWRNHGQHWAGYSSTPRAPTGWPLLGHLPTQMGCLAHRKLAAAAASCSETTRLMALSLGSTRLIISSHPDTARDILSGPAFSDRPIKESARLLLFDHAIGFAPAAGGRDQHWRRLRRIASCHLLSPKRVAGLEGLRRRLAEEMVGGVVGRGMIMGEGEGVVELRGVLQEGALRNALESVFGSGLEEKVMEGLGVMVREGYELIGSFNWEDYFPGVRWLDFRGVRKRCGELGTMVKAVVGQIVEERKLSSLPEAAGSTPEGDGRSNDFLSVLLSLPEEERLSDSDTVAVLWEMIFRGTDTVAILLEWTMARIVLHPDVQSKAQQEIDTCVGNDRHVQDSDIPKLPYLQAIVKEVLRMHPPGPLLSWARLATHDVHVGKFLVPAGTTAMVNMWAITHDPSIWKDPWVFKPERFMEEDVSIMGSDMRLAPFGSGRRVCPGKALGLATVHVWLARLLQQYRWVSVHPVDLSERLRLSMEMKRPLTCRAIRRGGDCEGGN